MLCSKTQTPTHSMLCFSSASRASETIESEAFKNFHRIIYELLISTKVSSSGFALAVLFFSYKIDFPLDTVAFERTLGEFQDCFG